MSVTMTTHFSDKYNNLVRICGNDVDIRIVARTLAEEQPFGDEAETRLRNEASRAAGAAIEIISRAGNALAKRLCRLPLAASPVRASGGSPAVCNHALIETLGQLRTAVTFLCVSVPKIAIQAGGDVPPEVMAQARAVAEELDARAAAITEHLNASGQTFMRSLSISTLTTNSSIAGAAASANGRASLGRAAQQLLDSARIENETANALLSFSPDRSRAAKPDLGRPAQMQQLSVQRQFAPRGLSQIVLSPPSASRSRSVDATSAIFGNPRNSGNGEDNDDDENNSNNAARRLSMRDSFVATVPPAAAEATVTVEPPADAAAAASAAAATTTTTTKPTLSRPALPPQPPTAPKTAKGVKAPPPPPAAFGVAAASDPNSFLSPSRLARGGEVAAAAVGAAATAAGPARPVKDMSDESVLRERRQQLSGATTDAVGAVCSPPSHRMRALDRREQELRERERAIRLARSGEGEFDLFARPIVGTAQHYAYVTEAKRAARGLILRMPPLYIIVVAVYWLLVWLNLPAAAPENPHRRWWESPPSVVGAWDREVRFIVVLAGALLALMPILNPDLVFVNLSDPKHRRPSADGLVDAYAQEQIYREQLEQRRRELRGPEYDQIRAQQEYRYAREAVESMAPVSMRYSALPPPYAHYYNPEWQQQQQQQQYQNYPPNQQQQQQQNGGWNGGSNYNNNGNAQGGGGNNRPYSRVPASNNNNYVVSGGRPPTAPRANPPMVF